MNTNRPIYSQQGIEIQKYHVAFQGQDDLTNRSYKAYSAQGMQVFKSPALLHATTQTQSYTEKTQRPGLVHGFFYLFKKNRRQYQLISLQ